MEEPKTEAEERTRQTMNESNPNTPDNITARKKADEEYQNVVAKAALFFKIMPLIILQDR
ncbi:hypothetical protein XBKQ1_2100027 [Xenorhabdus bovienii str. kraussei Quebec]|uniref:Uncharacterized protein n=1 Tax=Xenorhabdus bovienii str. kraussei Quebec TaxID=1398203 RepID=A0A077PF92_XENBV|nr:hypothetical protein [Xenorhabdus bovienii]CDH19361.1 hypothetical protein XBKQ1_2100027 [Xenorhabdus bovienii str. kraussei Quebec]